MIGCIIFIIIFLVGILYTVKNKNKKNELMVSLYDILCLLTVYIMSTESTRLLFPRLIVIWLMAIYIIIREKYYSPLSQKGKVIFVCATIILLIILCWKWTREFI